MLPGGLMFATYAVHIGKLLKTSKQTHKKSLQNLVLSLLVLAIQIMCRNRQPGSIYKNITKKFPKPASFPCSLSHFRPVCELSAFCRKPHYVNKSLFMPSQHTYDIMSLELQTTFWVGGSLPLLLGPPCLASSDKLDGGLVNYLIYFYDVVSLRLGRHILHPEAADWEFPGKPKLLFPVHFPLSSSPFSTLPSFPKFDFVQISEWFQTH